MAIAGNSSEKEVASGGASLYVGIAAVKVLAVNPTLAELHALDINLKNEPNYVGVNIGGDEYNKVVLWLQNEDPKIVTSMDFLIKPEPRISQSGKAQWTNAIGQFAYSENKASEQYEWFKDEGVRKAFVGEEKLMNFVKAFANVANGDNCSFETPQKIANGDVTELKELFKLLSDNKVRVLLGVKDGKYQQVYDKHFGRLKPKRDDLFVRQLNDDYGAFKAEYNSTLELELYSPDVVSADPEPASMQSEGSDDGWL
jgi:hypothetical protein